MAFGKDGEGGPRPSIADIPSVITFADGLPIFTTSKLDIGGIGANGTPIRTRLARRPASMR
jgi:hypothetical protein